MKIKELNINGIVYAKYQVGDSILFLKVVKQIIPKNEFESENFLVKVISSVEKKKFQYMSYLNLKAKQK